MAFEIFGMKFGKEYIPMTQNIPTPSATGFAFSTPFMKVGSGNLSLPVVDKYYTQNGIVRFGEDNLYPQLLNQMYYTSPMHGGLIEFITNATIGGGYSFTLANLSGSEKVELLTFEKKMKLEKLSRLLTRDYVIHRRVCVVVSRDDKGKLLRLKRVDPSTIRNYVNNEKFVFNADWSRGLAGVKEYNRFNPGTRENDTLYVYQDETPGQDIYPIPGYNSVLNWCNLAGDIAFFQKANIQNGVFPSAVIRRPKEFSSIDEIQKFKAEIGSSTGAGNGGRLMVLTGNGMDDTPEFIQVQSNNNDKLFETTLRDLNSEIAKGHRIDPSIAGISIGGSLGNNQQMEMSYSIFEKDVVMPLRKTIEEILNDLIDIARIPNSIKINDYQIIEKTIIENKNNNL
jgi:hypothetical protein